MTGTAGLQGLDFDLAGMLQKAPGFVSENGGPLGALTKGFQLVDGISPNVGIDLKQTFGVFAKLIPQSYEATKALVVGQMKKYGIDAGIISDDVIDKQEFARLTATRGFAELAKYSDIALDSVTEQNYPDEFKKAREFAAAHGLDLQGSPELLQGLAGFEIGAARMIKEYEANGTVPGLKGEKPDLQAAPVPGGGG